IDISNRLNAWLLFLGSDDPGDIIRLIEASPEFKAMYQQIYEMCESVEDMMGLFSKELAIMDSNTVTYMMDEMQAEIDKQKELIDQNIDKIYQQKVEIDQQKVEIDQQKVEIDQQKVEIDRQRAALAEKDRLLEELQTELALLRQKS
ncbi:MAG: hypothetical protein IIX65_06800, partial [Lachnospiraceae bacterium]|nr:hypothetical protein [Lachnospiraceae bacterium]